MHKKFLAALVVALVIPFPAEAQPVSRDCSHVYSLDYYRAIAKNLIRHERTVPKRDLYRLGAMRYCAVSERAGNRMRRYTRRLLAERRVWLASIYWQDRFAALSPADRNWAHTTGDCESGNNPATNTGNGFYGAFQFMRSTWQSAQSLVPSSRRYYGTPNNVGWFQQAVVAVLWMHRTSDEQWPVCGD